MAEVRRSGLPGRGPGLDKAALAVGAELAVATDDGDVLAKVPAGHVRLGDIGAVFPGLTVSPPGLYGHAGLKTCIAAMQAPGIAGLRHTARRLTDPVMQGSPAVGGAAAGGVTRLQA